MLGTAVDSKGVLGFLPCTHRDTAWSPHKARALVLWLACCTQGTCWSRTVRLEQPPPSSDLALGHHLLLSHLAAFPLAAAVCLCGNRGKGLLRGVCSPASASSRHSRFLSGRVSRDRWQGAGRIRELLVLFLLKGGGTQMQSCVPPPSCNLFWKLLQDHPPAEPMERAV